MKYLKKKHVYSVIVILHLLLLSQAALAGQTTEGTIHAHQFISIFNAQPEDTIFLDVRTPEEAAKGKLKNSTLIPIDELQKRYAELPKDVNIIIYDSNGRRAEKAYLALKASGYASVQFLRAEVKFAPDGTYTVTPLYEGEISISEFTKIIESKPEDLIILDVRTPEEAAKGKFKDSILIPIKELQTRYTELPKDKEIVIHCSVGRRAYKAYHLLKDSGYINVRYLQSKVAFLPDGTYTITK